MSRLIFVIFALFGAVSTTYAASIDNCTLIDNCDNCTASGCHWIQCLNEDPTCQIGEAAQFCNEIPCNDTTPTTTPEPTTTEVPTTEPPTTEPPTTEVPTTTDAPETTTTTPEPTTPPSPEPTPTEPPEPTTTDAPAPTAPPTDVPTTDAPATTTAKPPPPPSGRHFDAASFFGGMVLSVGIISVAFAAWRFYKSRNGQSYHTLPWSLMWPCKQTESKTERPTQKKKV